MADAPTPAALALAIDGPAASGKSTVAHGVARALGLAIIDTGSLYRTVALAARRRGVGWTDDDALAGVVAGLDVKLEPSDGGFSVLLEGEDVTKAIRAPEISHGASVVAARPVVREGLLELQRRLAHRPPGAVLTGRDIGTVVLPDATVKFFLTASPEVRARRRHDEYVARGEDARYEDVLAAVRERDEKDRTRAVAPLRQAADAVLVDSSDLGIEEVVDRMLGEVRARRR